MKERLVNFSFLASGHIVQDIVITDDNYSGEDIVRMLNTGQAFTSVHEDNDVILPDGTTIGTVRYSDTELEYEEFQLEGGEYESENALQPFNASRLARKGALAEFVSNYEIGELEIMGILIQAGNEVPVVLDLEEGHKDKTGNQLLREIELFEHGLMNLMTIAHAAGKKGKEIV